MRAHGRRVLGLAAAVATALGAVVGAGSAAAAAEDPGDVGFSVTPTAGLQFGNVQVAHSSDELRFDVSVPAGWTLDGVDTQAGTGNLDDFQLDVPSFHDCAARSAPALCSIGYSFVPSRVGAESATAEFEFLQNGTADVIQRVSRSLSGTGIAPGPGASGFSVSPSTLDFGDQPVGVESAPKIVTVDVPAGWSLAGFGVGGNEFAADDAAVQAGENTPGPTQCAIGVTFTPGGTGSRSAGAEVSITPTPGGGAENKSISFKGTGVGDTDFSVSPASLDFGDVNIGSTSTPRTVTVDVPAGWSLAGFGVGGSEFVADDAAVQACENTPGPTQCAIGVAFTPGGAGSRSASAEISITPTPGGGARNKNISFRGKGVSPGVGGSGYSVSPTTVNFGDVELVPTPPPTASVTLNVPEGLELDAFGTGGADADDFTVDVTSPTGCLDVPGPVTCQAVFTFSPRATGSRTAVANFDATPVGGGPAQDVFVTLQGTGVANPDFTVVPSPLDFFAVPLNADPPALQYVTINIPAGYEFLDSGVDNPGGFGADLASYTACLEQQGPSTCRIGFTFSPTVLGPQSATGLISWGPVGGGLAQNVSFPLQGTGVRPGPGGPGLGTPPGAGPATGGATPSPPAPATPAQPLAATPRFTG